MFLKKYLNNLVLLRSVLLAHLGQGLPDKFYLQLKWRICMGYRLDLKNPKTYNEKLQWLKLYDRNPLYTQLVDKYAVKEYVSEKIGANHVIPTLGVWDKVEDIEWEKLPNQFVLKCTHDSGGLVICKDKKELDMKQASKILSVSLSYDYYKAGREWPYKNVPRKIIAEKYMIDHHLGELRDYKFFCFNGQVRFFKIDYDRFVNHHANYYDCEGNFLDFGELNYNRDSKRKLEIPETLKDMITFAEILSNNIPFVRVDFYDVDGNVYFGEMTFYPATGMGKIDPEEWDLRIGKWLNLEGVKK